jgi:hypothetical protein
VPVYTPFITLYSYIALFPLRSIIFNCHQQGRIGINRKDEGTSAACLSFLKKHVRQRRYELKKKYFVGVPADQVLEPLMFPSCLMNNGLSLLTSGHLQSTRYPLLFHIFHFTIAMLSNKDISLGVLSNR